MPADLNEELLRREAELARQRSIGQQTREAVDRFAAGSLEQTRRLQEAIAQRQVTAQRVADREAGVPSTGGADGRSGRGDVPLPPAA